MTVLLFAAGGGNRSGLHDLARHAGDALCSASQATQHVFSAVPNMQPTRACQVQAARSRARSVCISPQCSATPRSERRDPRLVMSPRERTSSAASQVLNATSPQESKMLKHQEANEIGMRALSDDELEAVNGGVIGAVIAVGVAVLLVGGMFYFMVGQRH
jgi:lactobin A/cerein 7B family class IIb bacteriocin